MNAPPSPPSHPSLGIPVDILDAPAVVLERDRYAAIRANLLPWRDTPAFPGVPWWVASSGDVPYPHAPHTLPGDTPRAVTLRDNRDPPVPPTVFLPPAVSRVVEAIHHGTPTRPGGHDNGPWFERPLPVWVLALWRAVERIPVPTGSGTVGLGAWQTVAEDVFTHAVGTMAAREWQGLDAVRALHEANPHVAPWPLALGVRPLIAEVLRRCLPAWVAEQPRVHHPLPIHAIAAYRMGPVSAIASLHETVDAMTREGLPLDTLNAHGMATTDIAWAERVDPPPGPFSQPPPGRLGARLVQRGWSAPVSDRGNHPGARVVAAGDTSRAWHYSPWPVTAIPWSLPRLSSVEYQTACTVLFAAKDHPEAVAQDLWWLCVAWWRSSLAFQAVAASDGAALRRAVWGGE